MSDDGISEPYSRFNKFENSSRNLETFSHSIKTNKLGLKRTKSNTSLNINTAKRSCTIHPEDTLSNSWSASASSANNVLSESSPNSKNASNNRLKRLRGKIESTKSNNDSMEKSKKHKIRIQANSDKNTTVSVTNKANEECERKNYTSPVNIYKNLEKWATPINKSSSRGLANERLQRLKKFVNNSHKDNINALNSPDSADISYTFPHRKEDSSCTNTPKVLNYSNKNNANESVESSHVSPLLRGLKRSAANDIFPECSTPKKLFIEPKSTADFNTIVSRSMRLVQSVLNNASSTAQIALKWKDTYSKHNFSNTNVNERLKNVEISTQNHGTTDCNSDAAPKKSPNAGPSTSLIETDSEFQQKMKMTAHWITSHHVSDNTHYNPFSDVVAKLEQSPVQVVSQPTQSCETPDQLEEMEWTNAEPDEEQAKAIEDDNKDDANNDTNNDVNDQTNTHASSKPDEEGTSSAVQKDPDKCEDLCIVVDTNIFIKNLSKLKDILGMKIPSPAKPILYIPWMVITELDFIKDSSCSNKQLKRDVMNSIVFINKSLEEKNERVVAQTVFEVQNQQQLGTSADDKIMSCCLQVKEKYESVILLSNDLNLKNKAIISGIETCSSNEIMMKIMSKLSKNIKYQRIYNKMSMMCTSVICECAKETYGDVYKKMDMLASPPWSLAECLKRFKKYWNAIFKDKLLKHFMKTLDEMLVWLKNHKYIKDDSEEYTKFMKMCITLCIYLRDIEECSATVEKTLNEITKQG